MLDTPPSYLYRPYLQGPPLLSQERRIELALERWRESDNTLSKTKITYKYSILLRTFIRRSNRK